MKNNIHGFTLDTEVWCSAGFYKTIENILDNKEYFMTDSFDIESLTFNVSKSKIVKVGETAELVDVAFGCKNGNRTVRCTPNTKFLTCYENNGKNHYKNETLFWVEAQNLKVGKRLVAEDSNIIVKSIKRIKLSKEVEVYSLTSEEADNFSIKMGVIVKGEQS